MPRFRSRALHLLRLSTLILLVLSMLARPMLEQLGGTHAIEHATVAAVDADHDHDHDRPDHDSTKDPEHVKGIHGLMHQSECGAAATLSPVWNLTLTAPPATSPPLPDSSAPRLSVPATLFRPPIV